MKFNRLKRVSFTKILLISTWIAVCVYCLSRLQLVGDGWSEFLLQIQQIPSEVRIKPVAVIIAMMKHVLLLGLFLILALHFTLAGLPVVSLMVRRSHEDSLVRHVVAILVGYAFTGTLLLGFGLCGLFYPGVIIIAVTWPILLLLGYTSAGRCNRRKT